jgi:hypothetical protein
VRRSFNEIVEEKHGRQPYPGSSSTHSTSDSMSWSWTGGMPWTWSSGGGHEMADGLSVPCVCCWPAALVDLVLLHLHSLNLSCYLYLLYLICL